MSALSSLGKYQIVEELGHGGFATVYKAHDPDLGLDVALKVLEPNLMRDRAFVARFRTEARVAARLRHPNIARVLNIDQSEGRLFIAIEYVSARNLRDRLAEQPLLDWPIVSSIVQQVAEALDYAHAQGVLHRDVKPSNILMADSGIVVLTDFGLAKAAEGGQVTTSGVAVGTYAYMAPEQASGKDIDARADLYSLGVVAYELCTGRVPFTSDSTPALLHDQVYTPPPAPSQVNERVAIPIETVLLRVLAKDRDERYQTGQEFATALNTAIKSVTGERLTALYQQALALSQQNALAEAEAKLRQVLAIRPNYSEAQDLLVRIEKRRDAARRYQQLAATLVAARAEAAELCQIDPQLPDPDGVLQRLTLEVSAKKDLDHLGKADVLFSFSQRSVMSPQIAGVLLLIGAIILAVSSWAVYQSAIGASESWWSSMQYSLKDMTLAIVRSWQASAVLLTLSLCAALVGVGLLVMSFRNRKVKA